MKRFICWFKGHDYVLQIYTELSVLANGNTKRETVGCIECSRCNKQWEDKVCQPKTKEDLIKAIKEETQNKWEEK